MAIQRYKPEQIVTLLRPIEVPIGSAAARPHRKPATQRVSPYKPFSAGGTELIKQPGAQSKSAEDRIQQKSFYRSKGLEPGIDNIHAPSGAGINSPRPLQANAVSNWRLVDDFFDSAVEEFRGLQNATAVAESRQARDPTFRSIFKYER